MWSSVDVGSGSITSRWHKKFKKERGLARQHIGEQMQMIAFAQCVAFAGLSSNEMILGATPSARHYSLLASYLLNLGRGPVTVRDMIVSDLRSFLDLGAKQRAADLLIVLRIFLSDYPQARCVPCRHEREEIAPIPLSPNLRGQNETRIRSQELGDRVFGTRRAPENVAELRHKSCACGRRFRCVRR